MRNENIPFVPALINKSPAIFKQMTLTEVGIVAAVGAFTGLIIGLVIVLMFQFSFTTSMSVSMSFALLGGLAGGNIGGFFISRLKRNKPEAWLDRYIEFKLSPAKFITRDQIWSIKRSVRSLK